MPAENLLGEIGKGHKIAFNVLNYGRFKLAAMCSGGAEAARLGKPRRTRLSRRQFGQPIATFGAIRQKLAEMTIADVRGREHALPHGRTHRRRASADAATRSRGGSRRARRVTRSNASLLKIASSEMLDFVVDEERADPRRQRLRRATTRPSAATGTRGSTGSSRARTRSTGCSCRAMLHQTGREGRPAADAAAKAVQDELMAVAPPAGATW